MAEVVVTGSTGFIGSHLVSKLLKNKYDICGTYNFSPPLPHQNHLLKYFHVDVTQFAECLKLINQENPSIVFHLVAQPIVTAAYRHPFSTMELTVRGSYNLLEAIRQSGKDIKAIVIISSDKVYGNNINAQENDRLEGIDHPYNVAKVCEDVISQSYAHSYGLPIVIARSANIYGGGDFHWDRLIPGTIKSILEDNTILIRSDGTMIRDYIYADDITDAHIKMAEYMRAKKLGKGTILNFGSIRGYSVNEVLERLLKISGYASSNVVKMNEAKSEILKQHINYDYAMSVLGWTPKTEIDKGLETTFQWYREWFSV